MAFCPDERLSAVQPEATEFRTPRRPDVLVPQQLLDRPDVRAPGQQVRREQMTIMPSSA
jgi:hypothetical protein